MSDKFLEQYVLPSDNHEFVGRIYDLSIVGMHFETYEDLAKRADCKYVYDCNHVLTMLTRRVESLNMVGGMLWPTNMPANFRDFPVSRHEWLTISADVFLARYISVVDCAVILVNEVLECGLSVQACTIQNLKKKLIPQDVLTHLCEMTDDQGVLRDERNSRFHHGAERDFSSDGQMFRMASLCEHRFNRAADSNGQPIPVEQFFREGLVELQTDFNGVMKKVVTQLDRLYDMLSLRFEACFSAKLQELNVEPAE